MVLGVSDEALPQQRDLHADVVGGPRILSLSDLVQFVWSPNLGYTRLNPASKEKKKKEAEEGEDLDNRMLISHLPWLALWGGVMWPNKHLTFWTKSSPLIWRNAHLFWTNVWRNVAQKAIPNRVMSFECVCFSAWFVLKDSVGSDSRYHSKSSIATPISLMKIVKNVHHKDS